MITIREEYVSGCHCCNCNYSNAGIFYYVPATWIWLGVYANGNVSEVNAIPENRVGYCDGCYIEKILSGQFVFSNFIPIS